MSLLVKDENLGQTAWRRRSRIVSGRLLFASLAVSSLALLVAVTGAAGMEIGEYLVVQVLSLYMGQDVPWLLITVAFGATGEIIDPGSGLSGAVVGNVVLGAIGIAGWVFMRAAPMCSLALDYGLDHPGVIGGVCVTLMGGMYLYLSLRWGD